MGTFWIDGKNTGDMIRLHWVEKYDSILRAGLDSVGKIFFCAYINEKPVGFLYLKQTGKDTVELAVMGVLKECHRNGIGKALFECAKKVICEKGYSFIQVKTVQMGKYEDYDRTNYFYISLGFKEFEVFPTFWDGETCW
ncbi:MAG: GNAT family N-acetyltransferase [Lachnospiraceae bacterium]|nr:GNAT family N-acetyltransferase [Lachnospiraceae bacterium]